MPHRVISLNTGLDNPSFSGGSLWSKMDLRFCHDGPPEVIKICHVLRRDYWEEKLSNTSFVFRQSSVSSPSL